MSHAICLVLAIGCDSALQSPANSSVRMRSSSTLAPTSIFLTAKELTFNLDQKLGEPIMSASPITDRYSHGMDFCLSLDYRYAPRLTTIAHRTVI